MGKVKRKHSNSSDEEDPEVTLGKLAKSSSSLLPTPALPIRQAVERPSPRVNASFVNSPLVPGEFLLFGGECVSGNRCEFFDETLIFNEVNHEWSRLNLPVRPAPRSAHQAVCLVDGRVILFGGEFGSSKETKFLHFSDTWLFDFKTYSWKAIPTKEHPVSRSGHRMTASADGKLILLFGGFQDCGNQVRYLDDLWSFDTSNYTWKKIDLMSEYESRPSARSGFTFVSRHTSNSSTEYSFLLYSGYSQTKTKNGTLQGAVANDLWSLNLDGNGWRWKRLKLSPGAPPPRSGSSSLFLAGDMLINFGGVIDEDISEEFLLGTCLSDLYSYEITGNAWRRLDQILLDNMSSLGGRFNCMMAPSSLSAGAFLLFGGIYEVGDQQFTLEDMYRVDVNGTEAKVGIVQKLSPTLQDIWSIRPPSESSSSEFGSGSESDDASDSSQSESDGDSDDSSTDVMQPGHYATLKDFFAATQDRWIDHARQTSQSDGSVTDKALRSAAFLLAKQSWDEAARLTEKSIDLDG